jgi:Helicase associated domain
MVSSPLSSLTSTSLTVSSVGVPTTLPYVPSISIRRRFQKNVDRLGMVRTYNTELLFADKAPSNEDADDDDIDVDSGNNDDDIPPHMTSYDIQWKVKYQELVDYAKANNGSTKPPSRTPLGNWVQQQCNLYKNEILLKCRVKKLNELNFEWPLTKVEASLLGIPSTVSKTQIQQWEDMRQELVEYAKANNGSTAPPTGTPLGTWAAEQRKKMKNSTLYKYREKKLNEINFEWEVERASKSRVSWDTRFQQLVDYKNTHGDTDVPIYYQDNLSLGRWVYNQRYLHSYEKLDANRVIMLESIGFEWTDVVSFDDRWEEKYERLYQYWKENCDTLVPHNYDNDPELASWVCTQRSFYKDGILLEDRIEKLEAIDFIWDVLEADWMDKYNRLVQYKKEHGDTNVPQRYNKDPELGHWVHTQRFSYKNNMLHRSELLNRIDFVWDPLEASWMEKYNRLVEYKTIHGDANVPQRYKKDPELGSWVYTQKLTYKNNKLLKNRINLLNKITFVGKAK